MPGKEDLVEKEKYLGKLKTAGKVIGTSVLVGGVGYGAFVGFNHLPDGSESTEPNYKITREGINLLEVNPRFRRSENIDDGIRAISQECELLDADWDEGFVLVKDPNCIDNLEIENQSANTQ